MNGDVELVGAFTNEEQLVHSIGESSVPTENWRYLAFDAVEGGLLWCRCTTE
jgi:hypothetical protein